MALNVCCKSCGKSFPATRSAVEKSRESLRELRLRCPHCREVQAYSLSEVLEAAANAPVQQHPLPAKPT